MNSRARFLTSINHQEPDRVPTFTNLTPQVAEQFGRMWNLPWEPEDSWLSTRNSHTEILLKLGNDAVGIAANRASASPTVRLPDGTLRDEWGMVYREVGLYTEVVVRPLAQAQTITDLDHYELPDPHAEGRFDYARKIAGQYSRDYAVIGDLEACVFELAWNLVGMEKFLMDMVMGKSYMEALLDRLMQYHIEVGKELIGAGADVIWMGDDFGTQTGMMISPASYRKYFKPRHARMIAEFKAMKPDLKIAYHTCGSVAPIIEDFIEIGIDLLNPIQPQAKDMDLGKFKKSYGDRLGFFGGVDVQGALPQGDPDDVKAEVRMRIAQAGHGGGFIIAPAHNIQPDTPAENILAYFEAIKEYGSYPLSV
jgi:uroporphyrinogen decarboxylase